MELQDNVSDVIDYQDLTGPYRFAALTNNDMTARIYGLECENITKNFLSHLDYEAEHVKVVAVHKTETTSGLFPTRKARSETFRIFTNAMAEKCGGDPNIQNAWYGGDLAEITAVLAHGFCPKTEPLELATEYFPFHAALDSGVDEHGLRHVLMCRVILGRTGESTRGSNSGWGSFDSGVDDVDIPTTYFVWSFRVNSHVFPVYVISFEASAVLDPIGFPNLVASLARHLRSSQIEKLKEWYEGYKACKMSGEELGRRVRQVVDRNLLGSAVKLVAAPSSEEGSSRNDDGISLSALMPILERSLLSANKTETMAFITKSHREFRAKKINRTQMIRRLHFLAGVDDLLKKAVKELQEKKPHL